MNTKIYWVGPRKSDIDAAMDVDFYGSITIFGDGKDNNYPYCLEKNVNRVNHNASDPDEDAFFLATVKRLIEEDGESRFYFYNPNAAYYIKGMSEYKEYFLNVNEKAILDDTNNKIHFQTRLKDIEGIHLLDRRTKYTRNSCDYRTLTKDFGVKRSDNRRFVFQAPVASGGNGTYIVDSQNQETVTSRLTDQNYIVSLYEEKNIPVNIHAIIFDNEIILTPGSIQLMKEGDLKLLYRGADFIAYRQIRESARLEFEKQVRLACEAFRDDGYRGVCGIDGIICPNNGTDSDYGSVYLLEINNRFQASTGLVNLGARDCGAPSVQKINLAAFMGEWDESFRKISEATVNYSTYFYTYNGTEFHSRHIHRVCEQLIKENRMADGCLVNLEDDGYDENQANNDLAYLYRLCFSTNIASINHSECIIMNETIVEPNKRYWYDEIDVDDEDKEEFTTEERRDYYLRLKIALLVQGAVITEEAKAAMRTIREATNNAVDIEMPITVDGVKSSLIINVPVDIKFVPFTPFKIDYRDGSYVLTYYGNHISDIGLYPRDPVSVNEDGTPRMTVADPSKNKPSIPYSEVGFLSTDRLRVHLTNRCIFKTTDENGNFIGCKFCNIEACTGEISLDNVREVVNAYWERAEEIKLTHFLVGGQTAPDADENLIEIIRIIHQTAPFADIYAMVIPYTYETLKNMYKAGLNQISMNIEVWNDDIAREIMPGKRKTSHAKYMEKLVYATSLFGRKGQVRSMLIVGLEPTADLMEGISELVENGIQPILSIFRPMPNTPLEAQNAPPMAELVEIYKKAQEICRTSKNELYLGPDCVNCQNNTLALPYWLEI